MVRSCRISGLTMINLVHNPYKHFIRALRETSSNLKFKFLSHQNLDTDCNFEKVGDRLQCSYVTWICPANDNDCNLWVRQEQTGFLVSRTVTSKMASGQKKMLTWLSTTRQQTLEKECCITLFCIVLTNSISNSQRSFRNEHFLYSFRNEISFRCVSCSACKRIYFCLQHIQGEIMTDLKGLRFLSGHMCRRSNREMSLEGHHCLFFLPLIFLFCIFYEISSYVRQKENLKAYSSRYLHLCVFGLRNAAYLWQTVLTFIPFSWYHEMIFCWKNGNAWYQEFNFGYQEIGIYVKTACHKYAKVWLRHNRRNTILSLSENRILM